VLQRRTLLDAVDAAVWSVFFIAAWYRDEGDADARERARADEALGQARRALSLLDQLAIGPA
jgi:hypothetical protein